MANLSKEWFDSLLSSCAAPARSWPEDAHPSYPIPETLSGPYVNGFGVVGRSNLRILRDSWPGDLLAWSGTDRHDVFAESSYPQTEVLRVSDRAIRLARFLAHQGDDESPYWPILAWFEQVRALEEYPVLDDEDHAELQSDEWNESWETWARSDFLRELEYWADVDLDRSEIRDPDIVRLFWRACETRGVYPDEDGDSMWIDLEATARAVPIDEIRGLKGATDPETGLPTRPRPIRRNRARTQARGLFGPQALELCSGGVTVTYPDRTEFLTGARNWQLLRRLSDREQVHPRSLAPFPDRAPWE